MPSPGEYLDPSNWPTLMADLGRQYPVLAPHLSNTTAQPGKADDGRMMEFYPPWETENPNPNRTTLELYPPAMNSPHLPSLIAGDMLHLLGSVDPRTNSPVDPTWLNMKRQLIGSMTPEQTGINQRAYEMDKPYYGQNPPSYDDWMNHSRGDAYIRGGLFPDANPDWQQPGLFTPGQHSTFNQMKSYLSGSGM